MLERQVCEQNDHHVLDTAAVTSCQAAPGPPTLIYLWYSLVPLRMFLKIKMNPFLLSNRSIPVGSR